MFRLDDTWVTSPTDLVGALRCEYQFLVRRAEKAGLVDRLEADEDPLLARAATLGIAHEHRALDELIATYGEGTVGEPGGVVVIDQPSTSSRSALEDAHRQTAEALAGGAEVVYQAAFFDGRRHGLADFVVRTVTDDGDTRYEPADTKLARQAKVEALLQLADYAEHLIALGHPMPRDVHLWLGDGSRPAHRLADLRPVLVDRRARIDELLATPLDVPTWGDAALRHCGRCDHCKAAIAAHRDLWLVAGLRADQRLALTEAGIATIDQLASAPAAPQGVSADAFERLRAQAALQVGQDATRTAQDPLGRVTAEVIDPAGIAMIPAPNPGDVFFDFEGDPLYTETGWPNAGLEYLWGATTVDTGEPVFSPRWAHDRAQERATLIAFLDWLDQRRSTPGFEGLHVYHYAPYEVTALKRLVGTFGTHGALLDDLLKAGVFVDLYAAVRRSVRISEGSYSIKRLEPLYMGDDERSGEVADGGESVAWYAEFQALREAGDQPAAQERLDALATYNEYDCLSTLRLRDWLISLPGAEGAGTGDPGTDDSRTTDTDPPPPDDEAEAGSTPHWSDEASVLAAELVAPFADLAPGDRTPAQQATAMVAAALGYHRREELPFWWGHFDRLARPLDDLARDGEALVVPPETIELIDPWHLPRPGTRKLHRRWRATVGLAGGYKLSLPGKLFAFYDPPVAEGRATSATSDRCYAKNIVVESFDRRGDHAEIVVLEDLPASVPDPPDPSFDAFPVALAVTDGPTGQPMARSILALARTAFDADGTVIAHPALDVLARRPPRLVGGDPLPAVAGGRFDLAIEQAVRRLDRSYLAVQGPPGTGKTWTGARVITALVEDGWKVGVVAQGHRTVEQLLDEAISAGLSPQRVVKKEAGGGDHRGRKLSDRDLLAEVTGAEGGLLVGGTSYDMVSDKRVPAGSLDLLVVDEAGQFSLADTLAVARAAPRLLLLGDPQQLPQVSQANHPDPVDRAALGWLADGHDTLPAGLGYFLDTTYRMHPELCRVVSHLSYDDQLTAAPVAAARHLDGVAPGVQTCLVAHEANQVRSTEEAVRVVALVGDLVGRAWTDGDHGERPLGDADILVVAPYNAQVNLVREQLDGAGHPGVQVGSVDKFQGAQAPVVIVSMAASSAASGRGSGFVLSRNRLNVAISRAQHTAFLVHAPQLTDLIPSTPRALHQLGAFLGVSHAGRPS